MPLLPSPTKRAVALDAADEDDDSLCFWALVPATGKSLQRVVAAIEARGEDPDAEDAAIQKRSPRERTLCADWD